MKQSFINLIVLLTCVFFLSQAAFDQPGASAQAAPHSAVTQESVATQETEPVCDTGRAVQVSGTAVVNVMPDRVLIQLGVQSNGVTPQMVETENSRTIDKVIRALKKLDIEEKDIVTDRYVIYPVYNDYGSLFITGYRIDNVVAVTLREINNVNKVIIAALGAGANEVINVEFYLSDLRKYRDQARELAVKAAREKAEDLTAAAGAEIGCVMNINETTWSYFNSGWYGQSRDLWTQNVMQNIAPAGNETGALTDGGPVNLGQISVRAEVSASFSLR